MPFNPTSPVVGTAAAGLTSPTYTLSADNAEFSNGKQYAVTALGGTQAGVSAHGMSSPFTVTMYKPKQPAILPGINPQTGQLRSVPKNTSKVITRKGVLPLAGQQPIPLLITTTIELPAGADLADANSVAAALSCHIGVLSVNSSAIIDSVKSGVL